MVRTRQAASVRRFNDLIPFRVNEVLLVSSPYDAFILQEDGHLTERMFFEYKEISLSSSPRFTHAATPEEAQSLLARRHFDLILAMTSLPAADLNEFARDIKQRQPGLPVALLALDRHDAAQFRDRIDPEVVDGFFVWGGDLVILLAVIKSVEDRRNVDHDVAHGNVRVIIMLEDSPQYYSSFLGVLYRELMRQSLSLYSEGLSELYRRMYMKSRPKVLHARSYEEGVELLNRYRRNILAVISDVGIPRGGVHDPRAGLDFARLAREHDPDLPLLLQSAEATNRREAQVLNAAFIDKSSPSLLGGIREFLSFRLGFGDFIFRTPDGREFDRAQDLRELEEKLATIPDEVLAYHASHNHISIWLMARSEFELAEELRPKKLSDFPDIEACRAHLLRAIRENHERVHRGIVSDFTTDHFERDTFTRIGEGYLGGKARGIAFLYQLLADVDPREFAGLPVRIPRTIVITTDAFDAFLADNGLAEFAVSCSDDREIAACFVAGRLPETLLESLELIADRIEGPLAIRSSSLLEDSLHQPFAGIYSTLMIPNRDPDPTNRLRELAGAVKLVYASTFSRNARSYLAATGNRVEEEKMAVVIQPVVGAVHHSRYYPHFAGLAQSRNYYPIGPQKPDDGIAFLALGLGRQVAEGGLALRFCPRHPQVIPQFADTRTLLQSTQRGFWALNLERELARLETDLADSVQYYPLKAAEQDGTLSLVAGVYSPDDQQIRDDLTIPGPRVITFNNILKHRLLPLPETLEAILRITERGLACPVEVEFACDMGDWGRRPQPGAVRREPVLYLLQLRPLVSRTALSEVSGITFTREQALCSSRGSLGHGVIRDIRDIIYVRRDRWDASRNQRIAGEVGQLNALLAESGRPCVLIGPGRWGTADDWLGIPVKWSQISSARVIIEASPAGCNIDPSQGTHFFHNITAQGVGYLTLPAGADKSDPDARYFLDWEWLDSRPALQETEHLRLVRLEEPLTVVLDGRDGRGIIAKPGA
jgi:CheY-like chemotaxis protein